MRTVTEEIGEEVLLVRGVQNRLNWKQVWNGLPHKWNPETKTLEAIRRPGTCAAQIACLIIPEV